MINIRLGQWETNSSSCHQIVINKGTYKIPEKITIRTGEYGWEFNVYRDIESRMSYLVSVLMGGFSNKEEEFDRYYKMLKDFLYESGVKEVIDPKPDKNGSDFWSMFNVHHYKGYVDHADWYLGRVTDIIEDREKLYDYLFSGKSYFYTDNDNRYEDEIPDIESLTEGEEW